MQRSFSVIDDDDDDDEVFLKEDSPKESIIETKSYGNDNVSDLSLSEASSISPKRSKDLQKLKNLELNLTREEAENIFSLKYSDKASTISSLFDDHEDVETNKLSETPVPPLMLFDSDESENEQIVNSNSLMTESPTDKRTFDEGNILSPKTSAKSSDNLSGRQTAVLRRRTLNEPKVAHLLSDSDESDNEDKEKLPLPGEYNLKDYEDLEVDVETKDLFQFISRYTPQCLNLKYKFKAFIPEFLPAVGDIDAFLKVYPPDCTIHDEKSTESFEHLGLRVLDEPATNQSDPAVLYLQLRAASGNPRKKHDENVVVKKIDNVEKNSKIVEKWIKDISDLHKSKSSVVMRYSEPMPDLDDLMQEWPEEVENELKQKGFPKPGNMSLEEYTSIVCNMFKIPLAKKKVQSLYLLFCLYGAIKQTQLYKTSALSSENHKNNLTDISSANEADQLVFE